MELAVFSAESATYVALVLSTISSTLSGSSLSKLYIILNLLQIIMILFLIDPFIPESVKRYLEGQSFSL